MSLFLSQNGDIHDKLKKVPSKGKKRTWREGKEILPIIGKLIKYGYRQVVYGRLFSSSSEYDIIMMISVLMFMWSSDLSDVFCEVKKELHRPVSRV